MKFFGALAVLCSALGIAGTAIARADTGSDRLATQTSFNIPSQPLSTALKALADQAGIQILFEERVVQGHDAPAIKARQTAAQALTALLANTDLEFTAKDETVAVRKKTPPSLTSNSSPRRGAEGALREGEGKGTEGRMRLARAEGEENKSSSKAGEKNKSSEPSAAGSEIDPSGIQEIVVTGSRGKPRSALDSPVPVDTFTFEKLDAVGGGGDLNDNLKTLVPSFSATPLTGDASAFVRSTSLRGLSSDETLILVNNKRRHRSAVIQQFAAAMSEGAHSPDVGLIPSIALQRVEVLRDGAAAQYGSDAIAGVVNFILKDAREGAEFQAQYGQYYEGETNFKVAGNIGMPLMADGFLNLSAEYTEADQLIRGFQPAAAQALVDAGIPNVGVDSPFPGDPFAQTWGRPQQTGFRSAWNSGLPLSDQAELYLFGNYADTQGTYRFFYRPPSNSTLFAVWPIDPADLSRGNFTFADRYPAGFTPYLIGDQEDFSSALGIRGKLQSQLAFDFSAYYGESTLRNTVRNSLNPSFGIASPTTFQPGDFKQDEWTLNADFSYPLGERVVLSFGTEWREETYTMFAGEPASYLAGPLSGVTQLINPATGQRYTAEPAIGTNGLPGTQPSQAGSFSRSNYAVYADAEWSPSSAFLLQGALRFEEFTDFGSTLNAKVATRYDISSRFSLRAAVSTGFRAPTPGQTNFTGISTTFDGPSGTQQQQGTVRPTNPLAISLGGRELKEETSINYTVGLVSKFENGLTITTDLYKIDVDDRIYRTQNLRIVDPSFTLLSFYTNGLNTRTVGADVVATYDVTWRGGATDLALAYNWNRTKVVSQNQVNGVNPVAAQSIFNIEENLPKHRASFAATHRVGRVSLLTRANYYGKSFDERGSREAIDPATLVDVEASLAVTDAFVVTVGAANVLDKYPNEISTRLVDGIKYPRRNPIGYDGGSWYLKSVYKF